MLLFPTQNQNVELNYMYKMPWGVFDLKVAPPPSLTGVVPCTHGITIINFRMLFRTTTFYTPHLDAKGVPLFGGSPAVGDPRFLVSQLPLVSAAAGGKIPTYLPHLQEANPR